MDDLDKKILSVIQTDFPVATGPFNVLADRLGADPDDVAGRISDMRRSGSVRRLGAVFDSRALGYFSTLVAARIPPERLDQVAGTVTGLHGVTHNYRREHVYNLWFTLTAESESRIEAILADLRSSTGIDAFFSLPALVVYKIRVNFDLTGSNCPAAAPAPETPVESVTLNTEQKHLVRLLQESLPDGPDPFAQVASVLGWSADRVIQQINQWLDAGIIRRFGAVVRHQKLGFEANGMSVYRVPADRIDDIGYRMAQRPEISHCYSRPSLPDFPYTLFGMIHGHHEQSVRALAAELAGEHGIDDYDVLFSTTEYKKVSMKYFVETDDD